MVYRDLQRLHHAEHPCYARYWRRPSGTTAIVERAHGCVHGKVLSALARKGAFQKAMERKAWSFALVSVAAAARIERGVARDVRLVLGGVAPIPWRVVAAERGLEGSGFDEAACAEAADRALQGAAPLRDNGYKLPLARELVRRTLRSLVV